MGFGLDFYFGLSYSINKKKYQLRRSSWER